MTTPNESLAYKTQTEPAEKQYNGLCRNCMHNSTCTLKRHPEDAIVACEEYDYTMGINLKLHHTPQNEGAVGLHLLGLCMNCDSRTDCTLPKAEAGVWHCEEYV